MAASYADDIAAKADGIISHMNNDHKVCPPTVSYRIIHFEPPLTSFPANSFADRILSPISQLTMQTSSSHSNLTRCS